jgi:hypothetical protein
MCLPCLNSLEPCFDNNYPGWEVITSSDSNKKKFVHINSGFYYRYEALSTIRLKGALVSTASPFYSAIKVIFEICRIFLYSIQLIAYPFEMPFWCNPGQDASFLYVFRTTVIAILDRIWTIVKSPICFLGLFLSGIYTTLCPLHGRALVAGIESFWNRSIGNDIFLISDKKGITRLNDINYIHRRSERQASVNYDFSSKNSSEFMFSPLSNKTIHLAYCFQPIGVAESDS